MVRQIGKKKEMPEAADIQDEWFNGKMNRKRSIIGDNIDLLPGTSREIRDPYRHTLIFNGLLREFNNG